MAAYASSYRASNWNRALGPLKRELRGALRGSSGGNALTEFKRKLGALPLSLAHDVAQRAAPSLTRLSNQAYDAGMKVYGEARPLGVDGKSLSLVKSGDTRAKVRFVTEGRIVRCSIPLKYARYLIGKYGILPNGHMPVKWERELDRLVDTA
jgi:hypothetical protein